jgi:hypothetical protein
VRNPGQPQEPQRVVGEDPLGDEAHPPLRQVGEAAVRVDQVVVAAGDRDRHGIHGEVALAQIGDNIAAAAGRHVDRAAVEHDAPRAVRLRQRKRRAARGPCQPARGGCGIAGDDDVDIGHGPPQPHVAHAAADEVGPVAVDQRPQLVKHLGGHAPPSVAAAPAT